MWLTCLRQKNDKSTDEKNFGNGRPLPEYSTINSIIYLCVSINSIYTWLNASEKKLRGVVVTIKRISKKSKKIPTEKPTPTLEDFKIKRQTILTDIGGEWYLNIMRNSKSTTNNPMLSNRNQEE